MTVFGVGLSYGAARDTIGGARPTCRYVALLAELGFVWELG